MSSPITVRVAEAIIGASPDFAEAWEAYKASDMSGPEEPYNHLGQLAHHLVASMKAGKVDGFAPLFAEVESQSATAGPEARDLIIVGFLEDLQNISLNRAVPTTAWLRWLGQRTTEGWRVVEDLSTGKLLPRAFNAYVQGPARG
jgi:hypothetical protein